MKITKNLILAFLLSGVAGRAATVFSDNFGASTVGYNSPAGYSTTDTGPDGLGVQIYSAASLGYFFTNAGLTVPTDNTNIVSPYGFPSGSGIDTETFAQSLSTNFALNTTYTFSLLVGTGNSGHNPSAFLDIIDGTTGTILATTGNFIPTQNQFTDYSVSFDTLTDPAIVATGDPIKIAFGLSSTTATNTAQLDLKYTDALLTSTADVGVAAPEPSTYVLLFSGAVLLLFVLRARRVTQA